MQAKARSIFAWRLRRQVETDASDGIALGRTVELWMPDGVGNDAPADH